jgi:hypothetical protein
VLGRRPGRVATGDAAGRPVTRSPTPTTPNPHRSNPRI